MTDFSVVSTGHQGEKRSWLQALPGPGDVDSITLDISKFTEATHFPNGFIPSGVVLGVVTASSSGSKIVVGPYDDTANDGRQTAAFLLFNSARVVRPDGSKSTRLLSAGLASGTVADSKLPLTGVAGALDANGKADLKFIRFVAAA